MAVTPAALLQNHQISNSTETLYTGPASSRVIVTHAVACNVDTGSNTFTLYVVPSGGSAGATNEILDAKSLTAASSYVVTELVGCVLNAGDTIQAVASAAAKISININGIVQT